MSITCMYVMKLHVCMFVSLCKKLLSHVLHFRFPVQNVFHEQIQFAMKFRP